MNDFPVIERSITSHYHGSKISGSQKSFLLTETAIYIVEQQKESMRYRFVSECNHT